MTNEEEEVTRYNAAKVREADCFANGFVIGAVFAVLILTLLALIIL